MPWRTVVANVRLRKRHNRKTAENSKRLEFRGFFKQQGVLIFFWDLSIAQYTEITRRKQIYFSWKNWVSQSSKKSYLNLQTKNLKYLHFRAKNAKIVLIVIIGFNITLWSKLPI